MPRPNKGKRTFDDVEPLDDGAWRCVNCDAMLRPSGELGVALLQHRNRDCRHPASGSAAARRERECQGCRAALAQVRALQAAAATAACAPAGAEAWAQRLWGRGAAWRHVFADSVVPEPTAEPGRGGIMGRLTADSLAKVLAALELRHDDALFDIGVGNGAVLGAAHVLAPTVRLAGVEADPGLLAAARRNLGALHAVADLTHAAVQDTPHLGGATVAYCFSEGLKDAGRVGDAAAAVLAACRATPTLRLIVLVHDAHRKQHPIVAFASGECALGRATDFPVRMSGGRETFHCWVVRVEPLPSAADPAVPPPPLRRRARRADDAGLADPGAAAAAEAEGAEGAAALGRRAPPCYVINLDRRPDRLLQTHKLLDGLAWLAWRRLEAVDGRGGELRGGELRDAVAPLSRELLGGGLDDPTPTVLRDGRFWPRLTRGAVGCALSHRAAWRRLRLSPMDECVLVLEDDVGALCTDFERRLQDLLARLARKEHWRLCLLGSHERSGAPLLARSARLSLRELEQGQSSTGLFGYLLHRRALPLLLDGDAVFPLREQLDVALSTRLEWGHGARWEAVPPLLAAPRSEDEGHDTDVQVLEPPRRAGAGGPSGAPPPTGVAQLLAAAAAAQTAEAPAPLAPAWPSQGEREAHARRTCERRHAQAAWTGQRRTFHGRAQADELRFSARAPYGVVAPAAAAAALGASLRVARGVLQGVELRALQEELAAQPRSLAWGNANDPQMARSKRKFFELDEAAKASLLRGADRVRSRAALEADLANAVPRRVCTAELARRVAAHVGLDGVAPLRGMQVNYQHTHYPKVRAPRPRAFDRPRR